AEGMYGVSCAHNVPLMHRFCRDSPWCVRNCIKAMERFVIRITGGRTKVRPYKDSEPPPAVGTASCVQQAADAKAE
ncbi:hypothetical protein VPJ68_04255, partial [Parabacteroides distasonis]